MKLSTAVITYILTVLLCLALPIACKWWASKKQIKFSVLHSVLGVVFFVIYLVAYYLMLRYYLNAEDGITNYYNTATYRVTITVLQSLFLSVLLWIIAALLYARRQAYKQCLSFFVGFGCGASFLMGLYAFMMLVGLVWQYLSSTLLSFDETVKAFYFSTETYLPVFTPMLGHISFAIGFLCLLTIAVSFALALNRMTAKRVKFFSKLISFLGINISFSVLVTVLFFMQMFNMPHYLMAIVAIVCALISVGGTYLVYKNEVVDFTGYTKQFE